MSEPMNKGLTPDRSSRTSGKERDRDLGSIASHAIAVMASRVPHPGSWDEAALAHLESAVSDADRGRRIAVVDAMNAAGLEDVDIVDRYIPETARRIGEKWHQDDLSFADVTIRVSRLQAMAREMAVEWERSVESDPAAPAALVVVRRNEHHTLGASVLASQLRRMGVAVRVSLCSPDEDVVAEARDGDYRMVAISSSSYESVYSLRDLVA
ncbi:MAG: cobalamin-dependent protein, partial [Pseudomonadota bacterium]